MPAALIVHDEALMPADYWKVQPAKLDRRGLAVALGQGRPVPGATLGNGGSTIAVRTR